MSPSRSTHLFPLKPSVAYRSLLTLLFCAATGVTLCAQSTPPPAVTIDAQHLSDIDHRLNDLTDTLTQTQKALQQSLLEIQRLHAELDTLRAGSASATTTAAATPLPITASESQSESSSVEAGIQALHEQQDIQQAEIKQHEQTKVETDSKYSLRVTGLALFNAFSNAGVVDNVDLPSLALPRYPGSSHGSVGATLRQTVVGVVATGPILASAQSSAFINIDFFGGAATNTYGYGSPTGAVRMREAELGLDWAKTAVYAGYTGPLISPLSPTSYATVAQPALAGSGNLWTWSPQIRVAQRVPISAKSDFSLEAGLIDPQSPNYASAQLDSPVEASRRPGFEGRVSYHAGAASNGSSRPFAIGVGAYSAHQVYYGSPQIHSWAVTGDWQLSLGKWANLSGEVYRGRALGGLGGGLYKDVLTGTDPVTGYGSTVGIETAGGWSQLKLNLGTHLEANAMFGLDDAFSSSFESVTLPTSTNPFTFAARNSSIVGNFVFRPRASLIFSPEYRRVLSWSYAGPPSVANLFTLSAGYRF